MGTTVVFHGGEIPISIPISIGKEYGTSFYLEICFILSD